MYKKEMLPVLYLNLYHLHSYSCLECCDFSPCQLIDCYQYNKKAVKWSKMIDKFLKRNPWLEAFWNSKDCKYEEGIPKDASSN